MQIPDDRKYTETHEWAKRDQSLIRVGITSFAAEQLGDIIYLDLPPVGTRVSQGTAFGEIESVKAVSELVAPVSGEIRDVNEPLMDDLDAVTDDPWDAGWMIVIAPDDPSAMDALLDAEAYAAHCEEVA